MNYNLVKGLYLGKGTFEQFTEEWGEGDSDNILFRFDTGNIWIYQSRKEMVYSISITDNADHLKEIKRIVRKGLKIIAEDLREEGCFK